RLSSTPFPYPTLFRSRLGWTPLQYAASKGHLDTVKMLIANKAMVNAPGPDGTTALMMAAYDGNEAVVRYLLAHGADATMVNLQRSEEHTSELQSRENL